MTRLAVLLALAAFGCVEPTFPPPKERPEPGTTATCATACERLRSLGCEEGDPSPGGVSCEAVCVNVEASGATTLGVDCVIAAGSCVEARACGYGGEP